MFFYPRAYRSNGQALPLLAVLILAAFIQPAISATYTVNNATDFNNLNRLNAGDVVVLKSGTYGAINKTIESSIADDTTAKSSPVLIYAETPGGVVIDAPSKIILSGRGITLAGLDFGPNSGIVSGSSYILGTASGSRYTKFSNIRFNGCAAGATYGNWIYVQGFYCTIEFCSFLNRPEAVPAPIVSFMPNVTEGGVSVPRQHRVSYCYFGPRNVGLVNGFETIRIGVGDAQTFDMQVTIEHNLFYRSIWRSDLSSGGEPEIISNKSKNNKILNNTFLESQGGICLRSGDGATVDGNFIFGAGTITNGTNIVLGTALSSQNGIRVIGRDHVVRNNYIENITGTDIHAALCIMSGESDYYAGNPATGATNSGSYAPAHNAKIYNNTFVNCYEINLGFLSADSYTNSSGTYVAQSPTNVLFYNNAWQGKGISAAALTRETTNVTGYTPIVLGGSGGNYFYETSSSKFGWTNGVSNSTFSAVTSAGISSNFDNYKAPISTSPLLNKATNTLVAAYDVRALARPTTNQDIGCFEREVTGSGFKPLLRTNVGPVFDSGPTNSYPTPGTGDSVPTILTASLPGGALTVAYSQTLLASGGDGALTWTITSGSLPGGLTLLPGTGLISGTPTQSGNFTFTVRVTDSDPVGADYAEKNLTISVSASSSVKLTINSSKAFSSNGTKPADSYDGKTSTRWSSSIPSKNPYSTGTNFGTNCTWIWWDLGENKNLSSVRLNWYNGGSRTDNYRIDSGTITNSWTTILDRTNSQLTNGYETVNFGGASGRYVRLVSWGNSTSNGFTGLNEVEIYGSTYVAPDARKTQSIIFGALDPAVQTDPPVALAAYSLDSSNNSTGLPISYDSSDPDVATVDGSTVTITGSGSTWITASQAGDTNYQAAAPVQQMLTVTQVSPGITSASSATAVRGLPFRYQITAVREPTAYGATNLPAGLVVDQATGNISGTPTVAGLFTVTLSAQNSAGTGSTNLALNVVEPYVYETFESYTNGVAVPLVSSSSPSGIKQVSQVTNSAGNSVIGGTNGKVALFNDSVTNTAANLEFNAGASGQSYLAASFELYNNNTNNNTNYTNALSVAFAAWSSANNSTAAGSNIKKIANLEFNQAGSLTTPAWYVRRSGTNSFAYTGSYAIGSKQTVHLFANDHDANTINYVGPDGNVRTLGTNNFAVFFNGAFIGSYAFQANATDGTTVLTGNNNLGRFCFNTTGTDLGTWLIDNVVVSDMPTDVAIPAPAIPLITSSASASGQAGIAFIYQTTTSELADSFICDGTLPANVTFNTSTGLISGAPNQSGVFPVTIYAVNSAGTGSLDVTLSIAPAPPNIFSGANSSLNAGAWTLGAPTASSAGGSYTDLVFSSDATNLTTTSGNINGKSWNVTNGSSYTFSSVRTNLDSGTVYKIGNTGITDTSPFTNTVTGATNEMVFLTNNSSLTLSSLSISNSIPAIAQLRNSGILRIETGSALNIPCNVSQSANGTSLTKTGGGKLSLSGSNTYSGATTINEGTLALGGSNASAVTIKSSGILETSLTGSTAPSAVLSGALTLEAGAKVRVVGTPSAGSTNTLVTAATFSGTPVLLNTIAGFELSNNATSLFLVPSAADTTKPVISLNGAASVSVEWGSAYVDAGATATDDRDPAVNVTTNGSVDTSVLGTYLITYQARDTAGNDATPVNRSVNVQMADPTSSGSDGFPKLLKYALGGTNAGDAATLPVLSKTTNLLTITATVRTNDPALGITGQAATDLTGSGNWTTSGVSVSPSLDQLAVPPGCQKRDFSVEIGADPKKFLRLLINR